MSKIQTKQITLVSPNGLVEKTIDMDDSGVVKVNGGQVVTVESGSNANGTYIKYSDGTLTCLFIRTSGAIANTIIDGFIWTYPIPFIEKPKLVASIESNTTGVNSAKVRVGFNSSNNVNTTVYSFNETTETVTLQTSIIAIGRWKV